MRGRNGGGPVATTGPTAEMNTLITATTKAPACAQGSGRTAAGAVLHAVRLLPCARRKIPDDIAPHCPRCQHAHRFRGYEGCLTYSRRLPCKPWVTCCVVVATLPTAVDLERAA
jgi:hypothetical protein